MAGLPRANLKTVKLQKIGNGEGFSAKAGRLAPLLGMESIGCSVIELEPGEKGWPFHLHYGEEELFVILDGTGHMRYGDEQYEVVEGDVLFTPPGEGTAHQIINTSDAPLTYLAFSSHSDPAFCYYPDSGKYAAYTQQTDGTWKAFIAHESSDCDYYDGEDG